MHQFFGSEPETNPKSNPKNSETMKAIKNVLDQMVKDNLPINGTAKLAHVVTVTLKCWNGWKDADRTFELDEVVRIGKAGVVHFTNQFVFIRISELSDADCNALKAALKF